jgi:hypothetical protein
MQAALRLSCPFKWRSWPLFSARSLLVFSHDCVAACKKKATEY